MTQHQPASEHRFLGDSEMAMLMQTQDWSLTSLGAIASWSPCFRTALNILLNTSCPMFLVWGHDRILMYNDAYSAVLREHQMVAPVGTSLATNHDSEWDRLASDVEQVFSTQRSLQRQHQPFPGHREGNPATSYYTWHYSPVWDGIDQVGGVFATGQNVGSQITSPGEKTLLEEKNRLRLITDTLPVLIAYVDKQHYYRFNNQTYETWLGLPAATLTHQHVRDVLGESAYEAVLPYMEQVLSGQPVSYESQISYQGGETRYVKADYIPHINAHGEVEGYCSLVSDISDRKRIEHDRNQAAAALQKSEADFRAMFTVTSVGMAQADVKTRRWLHVNAALCAITGYTEAELLTLTVDDINHPEEREREQDYFANLRQGTTSIYQAEKRYLRKDGRVVWVLVTGNVIHDAEGEVSRLVMVIQDMTKRKQSEKALRRSESRFRLVTQAVNGLIFDWNLQTNDVYRSDKLYDLIGVFRNDAPASASWWQERVHPEDMARLQARVVELFASSDPFYDSEYRIRHEQGHWVDVWEQGCLIRDDQGQVIRIVGCTVDISDRKRAEQNLRESERRFRRLVESNMFGVAFGNFQGGVQYANDYFLRMVGYSRTDLESGQIQWTNMTPSEFLPLDDQAIEELRTRGIATPFEKEYLRKDGSRIPIMIGSALLQQPYDQQQEIIAFFLDLTEQKRIEAEREQVLHQLETSLGQLEAVINNMSEGLVIADPEGNILTFNPAALALHGYNSVEEVQKHLQEFPDIIVAHDLQGNLIPLDQWPIARALQGETLANCEVQIHRCDTGKTFIGSYSATPVWDKQGKMMLAIVTVRDVTAQRQAQTELARSLAAEQAARTEAEAANRIKDEFLAILSHELRSPLNPILGWSRLLQTRQFDQPATRQALQTIERNAKLQAQLVDDLLDVSRILRGKMTLNICPIDLVTVIAAALETVRLAAEAKRIQIQTKLPPNLPNTLGDAARLQQIVWNLLSNAVKFTPEGGRVEVRLEQGDRGCLLYTS
ncbi:PAS domain S-box protein, partial [Pantanalinema rosaneae CENA516]|uniref:PAS domain-containing protein n=1 Tax=Pantanalinema rosaneae TaxID=1620701 RepID=UPI003D6E8FE5